VEEIPIDLKASKNLWTKILEIADKAAPLFAANFLRAMNFQRKSIDPTLLMNAVITGNAANVHAVLNWQLTTEKLMKMQKTFRDTAFKSAQMTNNIMKFNTDPKMSYSFRYINQFASLKIKNIDKETYDAITSVLNRSFKGELTNKEAAQSISKFIGLDERRYNALMSYQNALYKDGYPEKVIEKMVEDRRKIMIRQRATVIARTESMSASNYGNLAMYKDQVDRGIIDKNKYCLAWMITPDDRLCDRCIQMKNQKVDIGSNFKNVGLKYMSETHFTESPPLHPQCRCTIYLAAK